MRKLHTVEDSINFVEENLKDNAVLVQLFKNCYTNTLDTTVKHLEDGTTYVITGDIPAMWLRDSVCQLRPYYILAESNEQIRRTFIGLVRKQMQYIQMDVYANAFNETGNGQGWTLDETVMTPWIWERKYEIDSLCFPIQMAYLLWRTSGTIEHFDDLFVQGVKKIIETWIIEQDHENLSPYRFERHNGSYKSTLSREGKGALVKSNIGLTWSGFRPSDDACVYGYHIPSNMFAVVVLGYIKEIAEEVLGDEELAKRANELAQVIEQGIERYGKVKHPEFGEVYAYEVDGFGQYNLMDDANIPSLLAIPYIGYRAASDEIYQNTRKMLLSEVNPYFYTGNQGYGIGSPHTPTGYVWPIALAVQGLTSISQQEKANMLEMLKATDGGKGMMHESFDPNNPKNYTREWFSWANAMLCELILDQCGYNVMKHDQLIIQDNK